MDCEAPASSACHGNSALKPVAENLPYVSSPVIAQPGGRKRQLTKPLTAASSSSTRSRYRAMIYNVQHLPRPDRQVPSPTTATRSFTRTTGKTAGSNDRFEGPETNFQRRDSEYQRISATPFGRRFIGQRIIVTPSRARPSSLRTAAFSSSATLLPTPTTATSFLSGTAPPREERRRTKQSQNYLTDF